MQPPPISGHPVKIAEYFLAVENTVEDLNKMISGSIANGWQPYGDPFSAIQTSYYERRPESYEVGADRDNTAVVLPVETFYFCQALVRYE
jgi:hypothetical protein